METSTDFNFLIVNVFLVCRAKVECRVARKLEKMDIRFFYKDAMVKNF